MMISEFKLAISSNGELRIPAAVMEQMDLYPNDSVYVAYITDDRLKNQFHEFLLSPHPMEEADEPAQISVPEALLRDAHIPTDAGVQIICIDGAIILCRESALHSNELAQILQGLDIAADLAGALPQDSRLAIESLHQYIEGFREEEAESYEAEESND